jgi:hypothetical protein
MLFVPVSMPAEAQSVPYYGAIVELDKVVYSWTDVFQIVVVAPNFNSDPGKIDYIGNTIDSRITIASEGPWGGHMLDFYKLEETAADTGVFIGAIVLSGSSHVEIEAKYHGAFGITSGEGPWGGTLKAEDGDTITVFFSETYSGSINIHEAKAEVAWWFATLEWQSGQVNPGEGVVVTIVDQDMNLSSFDRDSLSVDVYSDSDSTAVPLVLTEKEIFLPDGTTHLLQNSGIFEGQIIFTDCSPIDQQNDICTPHPSAKVLAKPGDTITVEYIDYTLPGPDYTSSDSLLFAATTKMSGIKTPTPTAKSVTAIPEWIKNNAGWWADGQIPDSAFLQGIQFLIKEGIMVIPPTETSGASGSQEVPAWIKNNAEWWAEGQIDDNAFVSGIQYLIKVGIIVVT